MKIPLNKSVYLIGPRVTGLVTSMNESGEVNAAPFSWITGVSFDPPMIYVGVQKENRGTLPNVKQTGEFVVNIVSEYFAQKAVLCEIKEAGKMKKSGLTPIKSEIVKTPRIKESKAFLECKLVDIVNIMKADHVMLIGEVVNAECGFTKQGKPFPDLEKLRPLMHSGGEEFFGIGKKIMLRRYK